MNTYEVRSESRAAQPAAVRTAVLSVDELPGWLGPTYQRVAGYLKTHKSHPDGPPFAQYHLRGDGRFEVTAGFTVPSPVEDAGEGDVQARTLPGGLAATTVHIGPYDDMAPGYLAIASWITAHQGVAIGDPWEVYFSDPTAQPDPTNWRTEIVQPYRFARPGEAIG